MQLFSRTSGDLRTSYAADATIFVTRGGFFACLAGVALLLLAPFILERYGMTLLIQIGCMAIAALGLNILIGFSGQISLGHAAFFGLGAFGSTYMSNKLGIPVFFSIPLGGLLATAFGMVFGIPAARIKGLYLAIATLAAEYVLEDFFSRATWFTGGVSGAHAKPVVIFGHELAGEGSYFYFVLFYLVASYLFASNLMRSRDGRALIAVRDHAASAEMAGISLTHYRILAFGLSSFYAGLAGALLGHYLTFVSTEGIGIFLSIQFIAMIIIGGLGTIAGSLMGAAFMVLLPEALEMLVVALKHSGWLTSPAIIGGVNYLREATVGLVIVVFLIFEPHGLAHRWRSVLASWKLYPFSH